MPTLNKQHRVQTPNKSASPRTTASAAKPKDTGDKQFPVNDTFVERLQKVAAENSLTLPPEAQALLTGIEPLLARIDELKGIWSESQIDTVKNGLSVFTRIDLTPEERIAILGPAMQEPLTQSAYASVMTLLLLTPETLPTNLAESLEKQIYDANGQLKEDIRTSWMAPFLPPSAGSMGPALEEYLEDLRQPGLKDKVNGALNVLRVVGKVEADRLSRIVVDPAQVNSSVVVPARLSKDLLALSLKHAGVDAAMQDILIGAGSVWKGLISAATSGDPTHAIVEVSRAHQQVQKGLSEINFDQAAWKGLPDDADLKAEMQAVFSKHKAELEALHSPDTVKALHELSYEMAMLTKYLACFGKMAGAIANPEMPREIRKDTIQKAVEGMGPVFIKLMQTIVNQRDLIVPVLIQARGDTNPAEAEADLELVLEALKELRKNVTPMSMDVVRTQLTEELAKLNLTIDEAFDSIEEKPLGQGSMGQVHRVTLNEEFTTQHEIAATQACVKVLRPGLEEQFAEAEHLLSLTLKVIDESLDINPMMSAEEVAALKRLTGAIGLSLSGFIESFKEELDCVNEARLMDLFKADLVTEKFVRVPNVYRPLVTPKMIVMEVIDGLSLEDVVAREKTAALAREKLGKVWAVDIENAKSQARDILQSLTGIEFSDDQIERFDLRPYGYRIKAGHEDLKGKSIEGLLRADGVFISESEVPEASQEALMSLLERLVVVCAFQPLVHGRLHGDLHQGNFLIEKDLRTLVLLDTGNVITLGKPMMKSLARVFVGMGRKDAEMMALGLVGVSTQGRNIIDVESLKPLAEKVQPHLADVFELLKDPANVNQEAVGNALTKALTSAELSISPDFLQMMKTSISLSGNVRDLIQGGAGAPSASSLVLKSVAGIARAGAHRMIHGPNDSGYP